MSKTHWIISLFLFSSFLCQGTDIIYNSRSATALNKVNLFSDSTFTAHSNIYYEEGALFEVIGETANEHEDDSQNQKFKWWQVRATDGQEGWIFGDGLAVVLSDEVLDQQLKKFHKRKVQLNNGFENAVLWFAGIEGRDNFHESDFMNPLYNEYYLVITNERNQSVHINYAGMSAMGRNELGQLELLDITGDNIPELLLQTSSFPSDSEREHRNFEIFSMQAGTLGKLMTERMTLNYDSDIPSPALFKNISIEEGVVRVEYIEYLSCDIYSLGRTTDAQNKNAERCMEFVTYTYVWDERKKMLKPIYQENRTTPFAKVNSSNIWIKDAPNEWGNRIVRLSPNDKLEVIKHHEKYALKQGKKVVDIHLLVRTPAGKIGYVSARNVQFILSSHAKLLNQFYSNPPLSKSNWQSTENFIHFPKDKASTVSQR